MISTAEWARFKDIRRMLFDGIKAAIEEDGHHKSHEGAFEVTVSCPDYFHDNELEVYIIKLNCYVVGPNRNYEWTGNTFGEALSKCEADISEWIEEEAKI